MRGEGIVLLLDGTRSKFLIGNESRVIANGCETIPQNKPSSIFKQPSDNCLKIVTDSTGCNTDMHQLNYGVYKTLKISGYLQSTLANCCLYLETTEASIYQFYKPLKANVL